MINIELKGTEKEYCLKVRGHSGYAPIGEDIVCAGVSALVLNFASFTVVVGGKIIEMKPAYSEIILQRNKHSELIAETFKNSFETMTVRYGKYIKFSFKGV
jgi:uncharacterized protein YsxB (DUF464 family)